MIDTFRTLASNTVGEFKSKDSHFLAYGYPILHSDEIKGYLKYLKKQHTKAVHFCYAYRLGVTGDDFRANDDGEPTGSAGRPILGQLDSFELTNCVVVVVRYFGGTLLGIPGLIQAYKKATIQALKVADIIEKDVTQNLFIRCTYAQLREVLYLTKQYHIEIISQTMQLDCTLQLAIPLKYFDQVYPILQAMQLIECYQQAG